jgi:hypothetical protein
VIGAYRVRLGSRPTGRRVPALLFEFSRWLAKQPDGSIGRFELVGSAVPGLPPRAWLNKRAWCFAAIGDGSSLALVDAREPSPVIRIWRGRDPTLVGESLQDFLLQLADRTTGIRELDGAGEPTVREELAAWLRSKKVRARKGTGFELASTSW